MIQWLKRRGISSGAWFLEFQRHGAVHYHLVLSDAINAHNIAVAWLRIIGQSANDKAYKFMTGFYTNRECIERIKKPEAISADITKYAAKKEQKEVPICYQGFGVIGGVRPKVYHIHMWSSGLQSVDRLTCAITEWKLYWLQKAGIDVQEFDLKPRISETLWGAARHIKRILEDVGWRPNLAEMSGLSNA